MILGLMCSDAALAGEPSEFDGTDVGTHLLFQELDDPCQVARDLVRHEHQLDAASLEVCVDLLPEGGGLPVADEAFQHLVGIEARLARAVPEAIGDDIGSPGGGRTGGVVEQLADAGLQALATLAR